jgi:predicted XRE-type DNA-binding protein
MEVNDELRDFLQQEILTTSEVLEILGVTKQTLSSHILRGKLVPLKKLGRVQIFLRTDIMAFKEQVEDSRALYRPYDKKNT